jgi:hypothetical protein
MTVRELADLCEAEDGDERWPLEWLFVYCGTLRTQAQGEASTFEGDCASANAWIGMFGVPTSESVRKFLDDHPGLAAREVPDSVLLMWVSTPEDDL